MKISVLGVLLILALVLAVLYFGGIIYRAEVDALRSQLTSDAEDLLTAEVEGRNLLSWDGGESWYCHEGETLLAKVGQNAECPDIVNLDSLTEEAKARNFALWEGSFWLPTLYRARDQFRANYTSFTSAHGEDYRCFGVSIDHGQTYVAIDETTGEVLGSFYEVCPQAKIFLLYDLLVELHIDLDDPADRQFLEDLGIDLEEFGIKPLLKER